MRVAIKDVKITDRQRKDFGNIEEFANSLARYGLLHPIVIDEDNNLIAGHRRVLAAMQLGWTDIEAVQRGGLDELARRELELEENIRRKDLVWPEHVRAVRDLYRMRQARYGNSKVRSSVIRELTEGSPDSKTSYSMDDAAQELDRSKSDVAQCVALADALDEMPELENEANRTSAWTKYVHEKEKRLRSELAARTRLHAEAAEPAVDGASEDGDEANADRGPAPEGAHVHQPIFKAGWRGRGLLYWADSRDVLRLLPHNTVDCIITDPPFALGMFKKGDTTSGKRLAASAGDMYDDDPYEIMNVIDEVMMLASKVLKPDGMVYCFFHMTRYEEMYNILRKHFGDCDPVPIVWIKNTPGIGDPNRSWTYAYEPIFWCNRGNRRLVKPQAFNYLRYDTIPHGQKTHPTAKPAQLLRHLVQSACVEGEVILDPFAGSASTCVAAAQCNCKFYGIERVEGFYRQACENIAEALAAPASDRGDENAYEAAANLGQGK
jgi:DNA modification methylase